MSQCPCCSEPLLRHFRHGGVYWFCTHCWQEMPTLEAQKALLGLSTPHFPRLLESLVVK